MKYFEVVIGICFIHLLILLIRLGKKHTRLHSLTKYQSTCTIEIKSSVLVIPSWVHLFLSLRK